jgi:hypothetical protein
LIEAAKAYLKEPSDENKNAADAAADAARKKSQKEIIEFGIELIEEKIGEEK